MIESLVIVALLGLFAAVFVPWLFISRNKAQGRACLNNKRQLGTAWIQYAHDHNGQLTSAFDWVQGDLNYLPDNPANTNIHQLREGRLGPYVRELTAYKCPADRSTVLEGSAVLPRVRTTAMNQMIRPATVRRGWTHSPPWRNYAKTSDIVYPSPAGLWVLIDENPDSVNDSAFAVVMDRQKWGACWQDGPSTLHGGSCTFSFADGHCEIKKWADPQTLSIPVTYREEFPYHLVQPYNIDIQWIQDRTTAWQ